ncbi:MAG: methionine adenosyltransferase [Akkermansiaceae bacterium]|nr:methionine adenosyltransferase [Armatimonadota bacterium]
MATTHQLFTSESVTEGHPDKLADAISDAILDACLGPSKHNNGKGDPNSRVAIETLLTRGLAVIAGELTTDTYVEIADVVRDTILEVGYDSTDIGFDGRTTGVTIAVQKQSPDIAAGVDTGGAGDQGMMFGFACDETPELMPLPITIAHRLTKIQAQLRRDKPELGLRPDAKSQVTIAYNADGTPSHIDTLVLSTQHSPRLTLADVKAIVDEQIFAPVLAEYPHLVTGNITKHVNPTGIFVIGGPQGDTGLTGRKIIVDTYGGFARHGGGAFSGKDPTKVDRSAAYVARYLAKLVVAAGLAKKCEIQLAYAIGVAQPVSVRVDTFGTGTVGDLEISDRLQAKFDLTPKGIIELLDLRRPIYRDTARNGHFGNPAFSWENTARAPELAG